MVIVWTLVHTILITLVNFIYRHDDNTENIALLTLYKILNMKYISRVFTTQNSEAINQYSHYRFSVKSLHTPDWVSSLIWRAWSSWSSCSSSLWLSVGRFTSTSLSRTTWTLLQTVNRKYYDAIMKWLNILSLQIMRTMVCQSATKTRIVLLAFVVWHKIGRRRRV